MRVFAYGLAMSVIVGGSLFLTTGFSIKSSKEPDVKIISLANGEAWVNAEITSKEKFEVRQYLKKIKSNGPLDTKEPDIKCCSSSWFMEKKPEARHALSIGGACYSRGDMLPASIYRQAHVVPQELAQDFPKQELSQLVMIDHKLLRVSSYSHTILDIADLN